MMTIDQRIESAISFVANRPSVFSARDVAQSADMEDMEFNIEEALKFQSAREAAAVLDVSGVSPRASAKFLSAAIARKWWVESTLRWAKTDVTYVTSVQLARAMASAFDSVMWDTPPSSLLDLGRERYMVDDGCLPDTFVFPWASLLQLHPRFTLAFASIVDTEQSYPLHDLSLDQCVNETLNTLNAREANIVRLRYGLIDGGEHTLEEISRVYGVSRERIRQIEVKALRKLRHPGLNSRLIRGFAGDFMRSGGSFVVAKPRMTPEYSLAIAVSGLTLSEIPELGVSIMTSRDLSEYRAHLRDDETVEPGHATQLLAKLLPFLSKADAECLRDSEKVSRQGHVQRHWSRPRMVLEALRSLGRPAHFSEIAEKCNEIFPMRQTSIRNWHGALSRENMEELGIVWVGRRGMYGLKEHGHTRPSTDLYNAIPAIVEHEYSITHQPVSEQAVIAELRKDRRELNLNSVKMVLAFSDRLEPAGQGRYIPIPPGSKQSNVPASGGFDLQAAFGAFTEEESA